MIRLNFKFTIQLLTILMFGVVSAQSVPWEIVKTYKEKADYSISDEFNEKRKDNEVNFKKWSYRTTKPHGIAPGIKYVQEKDGRLICRGLKADRKGGGIVSKQYKHFGFYTVKFKTTGIYADSRSAWHPSIWSAITNGQLDRTKSKKVPDTKEGWLEIDMVEFETHHPGAVWSADAPARIYVESLNKSVKVNDDNGKALGFKKAVMVKSVTEGLSEWQTWGLEYNPKYLQMWKMENGSWMKKGVKIDFNNEKPSATSIPEICAKPMFWYLGNLFLPHGKKSIEENEITNSTLEIDFFRYYPLK